MNYLEEKLFFNYHFLTVFEINKGSISAEDTCNLDSLVSLLWKKSLKHSTTFPSSISGALE